MSEIKPFTKADAAKAVKRITTDVIVNQKTKKPVLNEDGSVKTQQKEVAITEADVLDFAVQGNTVVVVTTDGQKLTGKVA